MYFMHKAAKAVCCPAGKHATRILDYFEERQESTPRRWLDHTVSSCSQPAFASALPKAKAKEVGFCGGGWTGNEAM